MIETNVNLVKELLKYTFGIVPVVAGLDKFTNLLTDWTNYIPEFISSIIPVNSALLMMVIGVVEVVAGILVLTKPKLGALIVSSWLVLIGLTLTLSLNNIDVAVRDFVMAIGAFSLYVLYKDVDEEGVS